MPQMKQSLIALMLAGAVTGTMFSASAAFADADDLKWIAKCMKDNAGEGASEEVVHKYCACMNDKMDSNETQSITTWEKSHPTERAACDKEAGWK